MFNDPLAESPAHIVSLQSSKRVPNVFPTIPSDFRLAIVGDYPGADDDAYSIPFVGHSGKLLDSLLSSVGVMRSACFIGNACQVRPPAGKFEHMGWNSPVLEDGIARLKTDLGQYRPHCVLLLGDVAYHALRGGVFGRLADYKVADHMGSLFLSETTGLKCLPAPHPRDVLQDYRMWFPLQTFIRRAREEASSPELSLPKRVTDVDLTCGQICHRLDSWPVGLHASIDIEGGLDGWTCLGVASSPQDSFCIAFSQYNESELCQIYAAISRFCYRLDVPKILQNGLYDAFVLYYGFNILIRNIAEDTMLKQASIYTELPKGLEFLAALWTRQPSWKNMIAYSKREQQRRAKLGVDPREEMRNKWIACCLDTAVTYEVCNVQETKLEPNEKRYYRFNMSLLPALLYMEKKGFAYNASGAAAELEKVRVALLECSTRLELRAGYSLLGKTSLSPTKIKKLLYEEKGYPVQYQGRGPDKKVTADVNALLKLGKKKASSGGDPLLADLLLYSKLDGIKETLEVEADPDGRVRCAYNLVGTETMRLSCKTSPTGSGANLQTITKKLRKNYRADPGYHLFQCDLAGADGWTVAARCAEHGDNTMLDDYRAGLKPAKILALMYEHGYAITQCSREELAQRCKLVDQDGWLYFACKRIQHGTNYLMTPPTIVTQVMHDSYKITGTPVFIENKVADTLQGLYLMRYPGVLRWQAWAKDQVFTGKNMISASGHERKFFGRRKSWDNKTKSIGADQDTVREFLADEPQENTTYATNCALWNLWHDPENRNGRRLIIQPLHTVHDALLGQFPIERTEWAIPRIASYFRTPITIGTTTLIIPFEGEYGPSWGELGEKHGGGKILCLN